MTTTLTRFLPGSDGAAGVRLWLKASGYARRLLAGAGDPWETPAGFLSFFAQAQGLLRPDVAVIEVGDLYRSWTARHPGLVADMVSRRRASVPLRKMLDDPGPRKVLAEVVEAVIGHMRGRAPVVLAFPAPRAWLAEALAIAGCSGLAIDDDAVEDAAMYMADLLRAVSAFPIAGILLEEEPGTVPDAAALAACRPLLNVAEHYRWGVVLRAELADGLPAAALAPFDAVIGTAPVAGFAGATGQDVSVALWAGAAVPEPAAGAFRFAEVPVMATPELVLERLDLIR